MAADLQNLIDFPQATIALGAKKPSSLDEGHLESAEESQLSPPFKGCRLCNLAADRYSANVGRATSRGGSTVANRDARSCKP
jgi:hypothetical protein